MKNMPLVSVGIVTFNHKEFIDGCIDSALIQDYENIEIVIADDASTDGTRDILREYQKKYPDK
ncbi:MAG: glycosyltransferase family A protein, partial [Candidatus Omnitrophica bacterium]|nr:glycosyltransferase family A protein [Candidatus Omnitrophota bacterium]